MDNIKNFKRTNMCANVTNELVGKEVIVMGWVAKERNLGHIIFMDVRDRSGIVQIVVNDEDCKDYFEKAKTVRSEFVVAAKGRVRERESINPNISNGDIEILCSEFRILDKAQTPPIYIKSDDNVSEEMRLKYRFLDLRKESIQANLIKRARLITLMRSFLDSEGFIETETPYLGKPTPEGARDYLIPSRVNPNKFYALPQSPQLMKQLLMVAGMDRYYQLARCFRDEDLRANRQPEFTQMDIEMSFVDEDDVMDINERMVQKVFKELKGLDIEIPLKRIPFDEAMSRYGSDKPDLRFGFELTDVSEIVKDAEFKVFSGNVKEGHSVRGINIGEYQSEYSRKKIDALEKFVKDYGAKGLAWIKVNNGEVNSPIAKFLSEEELQNILNAFDAKDNALILIVADKDEVVFDSLGALRRHIASNLGLLNPKEFKMAWVVDFPMFEYSEEEGRMVSKHHPFTMPKEEDLELLETAPEKMKSKAYDLVINGEEAAGGSIRINNSEIQERVFRALKLTEEEIEAKFGFFVDALKYGTPPHGGIAYGIDRLAMQICETNNIKDVIAFPKTQSATDLLTGAPALVDEKQLEEIHVSLRKDEK